MGSQYSSGTVNVTGSVTAASTTRTMKRGNAIITSATTTDIFTVTSGYTAYVTNISFSATSTNSSAGNTINFVDNGSQIFMYIHVASGILSHQKVYQIGQSPILTTGTKFQVVTPANVNCAVTVDYYEVAN